MNGWMDGWMDGWMVGWMDGWMDGWEVFMYLKNIKQRGDPLLVGDTFLKLKLLYEKIRDYIKINYVLQ